jgi:Asp-tRNA(Asn)/Glu-tRNA(Gln) amidotransferase A subunit family amidase
MLWMTASGHLRSNGERTSNGSTAPEPAIPLNPVYFFRRTDFMNPAFQLRQAAALFLPTVGQIVERRTLDMPVGRDRAGMPVGLQLTAPAGAEERLLAIALAAERVLGTAADRLGRPPLLAS